jgi:hypothetical protein
MGYLVVIDPQPLWYGIFTERDYAWNVFLKRLLFSLIRASATSCVVDLPPRPAGSRRGSRL